jgi:hypothetical protein
MRFWLQSLLVLMLGKMFFFFVFYVFYDPVLNIVYLTVFDDC